MWNELKYFFFHFLQFLFWIIFCSVGLFWMFLLLVFISLCVVQQHVCSAFVRSLPPNTPKDLFNNWCINKVVLYTWKTKPTPKYVEQSKKKLKKGKKISKGIFASIESKEAALKIIIIKRKGTKIVCTKRLAWWSYNWTLVRCLYTTSLVIRHWCTSVSLSGAAGACHILQCNIWHIFSASHWLIFWALVYSFLLHFFLFLFVIYALQSIILIKICCYCVNLFCFACHSFSTSATRWIEL